jgi:hypothetical protein
MRYSWNQRRMVCDANYVTAFANWVSGKQVAILHVALNDFGSRELDD